MEYNTASNTYKDMSDADVSVPGFGGTSTVECVSSSSFFCGIDKFQYMKKMVDYFADRGYKRGVDIRAAPYDWRLAPGEYSTIVIGEMKCHNNNIVQSDNDCTSYSSRYMTMVTVQTFNDLKPYNKPKIPVPPFCFCIISTYGVLPYSIIIE